MVTAAEKKAAAAESAAQAIDEIVTNPHALPDGFELVTHQTESRIAQNTRLYRLRNTVSWAIGAHNQAILRVVRYGDNGDNFTTGKHARTAVAVANDHINNNGVQAVAFTRVFRIDMSWGEGAKTLAILGISDDSRPYLLSADGNMTIRSNKGENPDTLNKAIQAVQKAHKLANMRFCNDAEFWYIDPAIAGSKQKGFTENPPEQAFENIP